MERNLSKSLQEQGIRFVRILWCDNANVIRGKSFHTAFLSEHQEHGIGISVAQQAIPVMYDAIAPDSGLTPVGEAWLTPDWSTLNALPYSLGHARVMADLMRDGKPWPLCPRGFLRRAIAQAANEGLQVVAAFENEFYLLRSTEDGVIPADRTVFATTLGMDLNRAVIDDIVEALLAQKIPVERYYPESGNGQHEISIRYTNALQAADWQIAFRETVRGVALHHGLTAAFLPKIFANQAGSGCHLHLSLWQNGKNILPDPAGVGGLSKVAIAFVGGILHHLPALMALTTPSVNSYRRLQPHFWSGVYRCWGADNREAAVRVPSNPVGAPTHVELRAIDASANPYLALGAVIFAGLDGIRNGFDPGDSVNIDPAYLPESERSHRNIDRLPQTLGEAIDHLTQNQFLRDALGTELSQAFLAVRNAEWNTLNGLELEEEVKLLLERY